MERTIKFRGKRVDNGEWVYGDGVVIVDGGYAAIPLTRNVTADDCEITLCKVIPESVGQFTGMINKEEKELCEGDVVSCWVAGTVDEMPHIERFRVVFKVGSFCAQNNTRSLLLSKVCKIQPLNKYYECNLLGNIHDNPELLTDKVKTVNIP